MRIENLENKKQRFQEFFSWLFENKDLDISSETDLSLCPTYLDPDIYFPKPIKDFFDTKAMQRLGHISQLGLAISDDHNLYHTRLEHSKGVYNRKLEEFFYKFQSPIWRKQIEDANFKIYLIAELIKSAGHDMGHFPYSHAFEEQIIDKRGFHEEITRLLMYKDPEIQKVLTNIDPSLPGVMKEVMDEHISNFDEHDESSYDNDREDYLQRDAFYSGFKIPLFTQQYKTYQVQLDQNGMPAKYPDGSIILKNNSNKPNTTSMIPTIDVYEYSSLNEILKTLRLRAKQYSTIYMSPNTIYKETSISCFLEAFLKSKSDCGKELKDYLNHLKEAKFNVDKIDIEEIKSWDEIKLYSSLLDIARNHEDENLRDLAAMIIPPLPGFLNLVNSFTNIVANPDSNSSYSEDTKRLLSQIKQLLTSKDEKDLALLNKLKDGNFQQNNILLIDSKSANIDVSYPLISTFYCSNSSYKQSEPIYVKDKTGRIYELSTHPEVNKEELLRPEKHTQTFLNIPFLKFHGISPEHIEYLKTKFNTPKKPEKPDTDLNLSPTQVDHNIEDYYI